MANTYMKKFNLYFNYNEKQVLFGERECVNVDSLYKFQWTEDDIQYRKEWVTEEELGEWLGRLRIAFKDISLIEVN